MRTFYKSYGHSTYYMADGGGRDTYILENHGGNLKVNSVMPRRIRTFRQSCSPRPKLDDKMSFYYSDGSGRDSYISSPVRLEQPFHTKLRSYGPSHKETLVTSRSKKKFKQRLLDLNQFIKQGTLTQKLNVPKWRKEKSPNSVLNPSPLAGIKY